MFNFLFGTWRRTRNTIIIASIAILCIIGAVDQALLGKILLSVLNFFLEILIRILNGILAGIKSFVRSNERNLSELAKFFGSLFLIGLMIKWVIGSFKKGGSKKK